MSNINGFSDSQESALLGDEEYNELEKEIGVHTLPFLTRNVMEEEEVEEKYDINASEYVLEGTEIENDNQQQYFEKAITSVPIKEEFPGHYNFQMLLGNHDSSKQWIYSQSLKKVYINMDQPLPLRFKWDPPVDGLFLRTAMVFSLDQYASDPVKRCHNHMAQSNLTNPGTDPRLIKNVVRCSDPSSMYEERNEHLSIVTSLRTPQPGTQYVPLCFKFLCKNSCPSGMNRRPTELIFEIEDCKGTVLGRRSLAVRVCSCPKRDKRKEEAELTQAQMPDVKKRKLCIPPVAKKMMPSCDTHVFNVQLNIVGKENYLSVMKYAYDIMAGQAARTGQFEFFKPYMDDILRKTP